MSNEPAHLKIELGCRRVEWRCDALYERLRRAARLHLKRLLEHERARYRDIGNTQRQEIVSSRTTAFRPHARLML